MIVFPFQGESTFSDSIKDALLAMFLISFIYISSRIRSITPLNVHMVWNSHELSLLLTTLGLIYLYNAGNQDFPFFLKGPPCVYFNMITFYTKFLCVIAWEKLICVQAFTLPNNYLWFLYKWDEFDGWLFVSSFFKGTFGLCGDKNSVFPWTTLHL